MVSKSKASRGWNMKRHYQTIPIISAVRTPKQLKISNEVSSKSLWGEEHWTVSYVTPACCPRFSWLTGPCNFSYNFF